MADIKEFAFDIAGVRQAAYDAGVVDENVLAILEGFVASTEGRDRGFGSAFVYSDESVLEVIIRAQVQAPLSETQ